MKRPIKNTHLLIVAFLAILVSVISITIETTIANKNRKSNQSLVSKFKASDNQSQNN